MGTTSPNGYFYLPAYGATGTAEKALFDAALTTADSIIFTASGVAAVALTTATNALSVANTGSATAGLAFATATSAYATGTSAYATATSAYTTATSAYTTATSAYATGTSALSVANAGSATAGLAFATATSAYTTATSALSIANAGSATAGLAFATATSAYATGTSAYATATSAYATATSAYTTATAASATASSAYATAAGAIPKTLGTTKGAIIAYTGSATPVELKGVTEGHVLTVSTAAAAGLTFAAPAAGGGKVLQMVNTTIAGLSSHASVNPIVLDASIPQISEGTLLTTLAITPTTTASKLVFEMVSNWSGSDGWMTFALFEGTTANAIACTVDRSQTPGWTQATAFKYIATSPGTTALSYTWRCGPNATAALSINYIGLGGVQASIFSITEIAN